MIPLTKKEFQTVALHDIDLSSFPFSSSFPLTSPKLRLSIREAGLINPLILRTKREETNRKKFEVVAGARRAISCQSLDFETIEAFVIAGDRLEDETAFTLNLLDNITFRSFNLIEIAITVQKMLTLREEGREIIHSNLLPLLGMESGDILLNKYCQLLNLIPKLQEYIVAHDLPLNIAYELTRFSPGEQASLLELFNHVPLNRNKMREVVTNIKEVCERDNVSPHALLQTKEMQTIIHDDKSSLPEKSEAVRRFLKELRFPVVSETEKAINKYKQALRLPKQLKLIVPPYLEGEKLKIELEFKKPDDLLALSKKLMEISQTPELAKILDYL